MRKYLLVAGLIIIVGSIAFIPNIIASNDGGEVNNLTEEKTTKVSAKENPKEEKATDSKINSIIETLTDFELPKEGIIKDEEKISSFLGKEANQSDIIVYENGFVIDKERKKVNSILHFKNVENVGVPYGTQALAFFKTLLNTKMSEHAALHEYFLDNNGDPLQASGFEVTEEIREYMNNMHTKNYDPDVDGIGGWYGVRDSINSTINSIEKVEEQLKPYNDLYTWTQEAKSYFVEAKELGIENWEKAYEKYEQGSKFINELKTTLIMQ